MKKKRKIQIPRDLQAVFDDAREQLESMPGWRVSYEGRSEIERLLNNIKAYEETLTNDPS
jgi:hypothetical protein